MDSPKYIHSPEKIQFVIKPTMAEKLRRIAEIEGIDDPIPLILLGIARLINEKENEYRERGIYIE